MQYDGASYAIAAGSTLERYVWWKYNPITPRPSSPPYGTPELKFTSDLADLQAMTPDDLLLFVNANGLALYMPNITTLDGSLLVPGTVLADALEANLVLVGTSVSSTDYDEGQAGWSIGETIEEINGVPTVQSYAEFQDIVARGNIQTTGADNQAPTIDTTDAYEEGEGVTLWNFADASSVGGSGWIVDPLYSGSGVASDPYIIWQAPGSPVRSRQDGSLLLVAGTPGTSGDVYVMSPLFQVSLNETATRRCSATIKAQRQSRQVRVGYQWYSITNPSTLASPIRTDWGDWTADSADDWTGVVYEVVPPATARSGRMVIQVAGCVADTTDWWDQHYIETAGVEAPPNSTVSVNAVSKTVSVTALGSGIASAAPNESYPDAILPVAAGDLFVVGADITRPAGSTGGRICSLGALWSTDSQEFVALDLLLAPLLNDGASATIRQIVTAPPGATTLKVYVGLLATASGDSATFANVKTYKPSTMVGGIFATSDVAPYVRAMGGSLTIAPDPTTVVPAQITGTPDTQGLLISSAQGGTSPTTAPASVALDTNPGVGPSATITTNKLIIQSAAAAAAQSPQTDILGGWRAATPTYSSGTVGSGSAIYHWLQIGKTVFVNGRVAPLGSPTAASAGAWTLNTASLPASKIPVMGSWWMANASAQVWGGPMWGSGTSWSFAAPFNNGFGVQTWMGGGSGFLQPLAAGNDLRFSITYEAA